MCMNFQEINPHIFYVAVFDGHECGFACFRSTHSAHACYAMRVLTCTNIYMHVYSSLRIYLCRHAPSRRKTRDPGKAACITRWKCTHDTQTYTHAYTNQYSEPNDKCLAYPKTRKYKTQIHRIWMPDNSRKAPWCRCARRLRSA